MQTYVQSINGHMFAVRASRALVARTGGVQRGVFRIVPAARKLREASRLNTTVRVLRVYDTPSGPEMGYL